MPSSFNSEWRSVLSRLKFAVTETLHGRPDKEVLIAVTRNFLAFASSHEAVFNTDSSVKRLATSFSESFGLEGFSSLPFEDMRARLVALSERLDACIVDCVMKESSSQSIKIDGQSHQIQIGHGNSQIMQATLQTLLTEIEKSSATGEVKQEAKSLLKRALEHPLVSSIVGGLVGRDY